MHRTPDPGTINHMEGAPAANKRFMPEPTTKYNAGIHYNRLIERRCASVDLEATFKEIKISRDIEKQVCKECKAEFCRCPAFTPGMPLSLVSSTPTSISDEQLPELLADKSLQQLHLLLNTPSDEEADREVEAICAPSEYYRCSSWKNPPLEKTPPFTGAQNLWLQISNSEGGAQKTGYYQDVP